MKQRIRLFGWFCTSFMPCAELSGLQQEQTLRPMRMLLTVACSNSPSKLDDEQILRSIDPVLRSTSRRNEIPYKCRPHSWTGADLWRERNNMEHPTLNARQLALQEQSSPLVGTVFCTYQQQLLVITCAIIFLACCGCPS